MNSRQIYLLFCPILIGFSLFSYSASGQSNDDVGIKNILSAIENKREKLPVEKLYVQTDKTDYIQGDTLWFKSYLLNGDYLTASTRSGLLYAELDDSTGTAVKRIMIHVGAGLGRGAIALDEKTIPEGTYTFRAYTNWMQNFSEDYIFKKRIYIASAAVHSRLIQAEFRATTGADKTNVRANILVTAINNTPVLLQKMRLKVHAGNHTLFRSEVITDISGRLNINFDVPAHPLKGLYITVQDIEAKSETKAPVYIIPVTINRPGNMDLQFMPEGGELVADIPARVGFKAIGENGKGINVSGKIYDSKQQQVAEFQSAHLGMGSFYMMPKHDEVYTAIVDQGAGVIKNFRLPVVHSSGASMQINPAVNDTARVTVFVTPGMPGYDHGYTLLGLSRGVLCYAASLKMKDTAAICKIPKNAFPTGIAHFTLLNNANVPLAERVVYMDNHDNLQIDIEPDKKTYAPHDSVALNIRVTDKAGNPVRGSFSMAVTDDNQLRPDSLGSNLVNNLLLTSDLKGNIEEPAYYFKDNSRQRMTDLDNLLLTQGWIGYNWGDIFGTDKQPEFAAEPEFTVSGTATNIFNKPVDGAQMTLLSTKPLMALDTITGKDGRFIFKGFLPVDTAAFMVQARNKHGKSFNVSVNMDEFKPPVFKKDTELVMPWYVNTDTLLLHGFNNKNIKQQADVKLNGRVLKEVKITIKKVIKGSKNLNGDGESDQTLDEHDMDKAGKMTLEEILSKKVKGFHLGYFKKSVDITYMVGDEPAKFVIDGIYLDRFFTPTPNPKDYHEYIKGNLRNFTAEDIKGIELMYDFRYHARYVELYIGPQAVGNVFYAFIEITTRGGHGPFTKTTPGTYLYKPLAATLPRQFYRPRYTVKDKSNGPDLRSTIHWEPDIVTGTDGRAIVSFYSADKPSAYTIVMEGADLNGLIGTATKKVKVK